MFRTTACLIVCVSMLLLTSSLLLADVPHFINYQGRLTDAAGQPVADGTYQIKFKIYESEAGDDSLWWSGFQDVDVSDGSFDYQLGLNIPLPEDIFSQFTETWLGVTIGSDAEIQPRSQLVSAPYSFHSLRADTAEYVLGGGGGDITAVIAGPGLIGGGDVGEVFLEAEIPFVLDANVTSGHLATIEGQSDDNIGVYGYNATTQNHGYLGSSDYGVKGTCQNGIAAVHGEDMSDKVGVFGNSVTGIGVQGNCSNFGNIGRLGTPTAGVYGTCYSTSDYAGYFEGNTHITGDLTVDGSITGLAVSKWNVVDSILYTNNNWGIVRGNADNKNWGDSGHSVVNLGEACTTGVDVWPMMHHQTISGGYQNSAQQWYTTISGGMNNVAEGEYSAIGGGIANRTQGSKSFIGGGTSNYAASECVVGGGFRDTASGEYSAVLGGKENTAHGFGSSVVGGSGNKIYSADGSFIGGGGANTIYADGATIFSGFNNTIEASGEYSCLLGLNSNLTEDSTFMVDMPHIRFGDETYGYEMPTQDGTTGQYLTTDGSGQASWSSLAGVGGWIDDGTVIRLETSTDSVGIGTDTPSEHLDVDGNLHISGRASLGVNVSCTGSHSFGAGYNNNVGGSYAAISGGAFNEANGYAATIGGGGNNSAGGYGATVPGGGFCNAAMAYTFASGYRAISNHDGTFVWADHTEADFSSTGEDQFLIRASGGVGIGLNDPDVMLHLPNTADITSSGGGDFAIGDPITGHCLRMDNNEIQVYDNGSPDNAALILQADGGYVNMCTNVLVVRGDRENVGIGTSGPNSIYKLHVVTGTTAEYSAAISGEHTLTTGMEQRYGGRFKANCYHGWGVVGISDGTNGQGVHGKATAGSNGIGVYGEGYDVGVYGEGVGNYGYGGDFVAGGTNGIGIVAEGGSSGYAARFDGNVLIRSQDGLREIVEIGEGLDYAEGFNASRDDDILEGSVLIIDPDNPGYLTLSRSSYDSKVAGIVAGANGLGSGVRLGANQFDFDVALAGRVYCNVDASYGEIKPGDLLTTSPTPGCAMKATDYIKAQGAILGKAMQGLPAGQKGQILVLVTLQ